MNAIEPEFIEKFRPRAIIGKGGMSQETVDAMRKFTCVYLAITGGAAVLAAERIKKVHAVHWLDLGMPEALWVLWGEEFGPLIVAIDAHGNSLYASVAERVKNNIPAIEKQLGLK
jgi:tartrate/fumarate subfamily iron-sulfur-dependent hydro-lyase beta chain